MTDGKGSHCDKESFIGIIKLFLRYALITSCKYTADKNLLAYISTYTFISTYQSLKTGKSNIYIGDIIDSMIEAVAEDAISQQKDIEHLFDDEFLADNAQAMMTVKALNQLSSFQRQIVVLYDIEMLTTSQLSQLTGLTISQIRIEITTGEKTVKEFLKSSSQDFNSTPEQINAAGTTMDMDLISTVVMSISQYIDANT